MASIIYIEIHGNLGVGKSYTLSHIQTIIEKFNLSKSADYYFIKEPLDLIGPLLERYYEKKTHAISLQANCFIYYFQELSKLKKEFERETLREGKIIKPKIIFLDRSLTAGLRVFLPIMESYGMIREVEASVLHSLADELIEALDLPEKHIYRFMLGAPLDKVWRNIQHRGRDNEKNITKKYLQKVNEMHFNWASLLETKLGGQKMVFCWSQNDLIGKIVQLLTVQHRIPEDIDWTIPTSSPPEMKQEEQTSSQNIQLVYTEPGPDEVD